MNTKENRKTIRVVYPDWMGGANPNYAYGCRILEAIMPKSSRTKILEIPVRSGDGKGSAPETAETRQGTDLL